MRHEWAVLVALAPAVASPGSVSGLEDKFGLRPRGPAGYSEVKEDRSYDVPDRRSLSVYPAPSFLLFPDAPAAPDGERVERDGSLEGAQPSGRRGPSRRRGERNRQTG